jgi:2-polyprenyl-3-methyl-5-hydroxy-6-metoxy-1,4-benzoquinol methylase
MRKQQSDDNQYAHLSREKMTKYIPDSAKRILDVGCNTGAFGEALKKQKDIEVWGIEPKKGAAEIASSLLDFVVNDIFHDAVDVPDKFFDVIVFNDVLEHLEDPWLALVSARKKLVKGGIVVASIPNILHIDNLQHLLFDADFKYEQCGIRDKTHLRFFTQKSAIRMFEDVGFSVLKIEGINAKWWSNSLFKRFLYTFFPKRMEETKYIQFAVVAGTEL